MDQTGIYPETEPLLTFEEYLVYEGEPDVLYELFRGKLIPMSAPSLYHTQICEYLVYTLQRYFATENRELVAKATTVGVRTAENSARLPDVLVGERGIWEKIGDRPGAGVLNFAEKPLLVIEVVSTNRRDDYLIKCSEYAIAEIPEYWIIDPKKKRVRVLTNPNQEEGYSWVDFDEENRVISPLLPKLELSVAEILTPPIVDVLVQQEQAQLQYLREQVDSEHQRAETERQRAETERQRAETERQRAETERQRAERLAQKLKELGINPEEIN